MACKVTSNGVEVKIDLNKNVLDSLPNRFKIKNETLERGKQLYEILKNNYEEKYGVRL